VKTSDARNGPSSTTSAQAAPCSRASASSTSAAAGVPWCGTPRSTTASRPWASRCPPAGAAGRERIAPPGLQDRAEIELLDYATCRSASARDRSTRWASIGMFEHVGLRNLPCTSAPLPACCATRADAQPRHHQRRRGNRPIGSDAGEFIGKYVFPNGELRTWASPCAKCLPRGFEVCDIESLRPHYALTLAHWSRRLEQRLQEGGTAGLRANAAGLARLPGWLQPRLRAGLDEPVSGPGQPAVAPGATALPLTRSWMYR